MKSKYILMAILIVSLISGCGQMPTATNSTVEYAESNSTMAPFNDESVIVTPPPDTNTEKTPLDTESEGSEIYYLFVDSTRYAPDRYDFGDFVVEFPQVLFPEDLSYQEEKIQSLQDKVNNTSRDACTAWVSKRFLRLEVDVTGTIIMFNSRRFLSFRNLYSIVQQHCVPFMDQITIDMQTGNRVMLNDLVRIDDEFINLLHKGNVIYAGHIKDYSESTRAVREYVGELTTMELHDKLTECSTELCEYTSTEGDLRLGHIGSFHIESGKIIIFLSYSYEFTLYLDDIEEFLKVPKW